MSYVNQNLISSLAYLKNVNWFRNQHTIKSAMKSGEVPMLYKSKHFLILNKPFDMIVYNFNKQTSSMPSLYSYLREKYPYYYDPRLTGGFHVLHRLDAITSGVICIPLNYFSQRIAVQAFKTENVEKYYLALVYGKIKYKKEFTIDVPIGDDINNYSYLKCPSIDETGGKNSLCVNPQEAQTKVQVIEYGTYKGKECSKLVIILIDIFMNS